MATSILVGGPREGQRVPDQGAFYVRAGAVYRWYPEWSAYVYDPTSRYCLNCTAIVEVPGDVSCPLCGYTDGDVYEDAG